MPKDAPLTVFYARSFVQFHKKSWLFLKFYEIFVKFILKKLIKNAIIINRYIDPAAKIRLPGADHKGKQQGSRRKNRKRSDMTCFFRLFSGGLLL